MENTIPKRIIKNIGVVAPASPHERKYITNKIDTFEHLGYNIIESKHLYDINGYLCGDDKDRANDLNSMFSNNDIDAIVCFRGGYGSIRMAEFLDLNLIKNNPKIFCGYSDITLLLNYISEACKFPTFHGPMVNSDFDDTITKGSFLNLLKNNNSNYIYNLNNFIGCDQINTNNFSGKLVGGNLSIICSTIGTPYEINLDNNILLIEEINEAPYVIDRLLSQLIYSQKLSKCTGIILGHFTDCGLNDYSRSFSVDEVISNRLFPLNIPIIKNFPFGHDYPNLVLPIGTTINYDHTSKILKIISDIFI
ncbi:MAG: S66 peptidase family protein [Clostridium sp.]